MTCTIHGDDACCTLCMTTTDGRGFPHPTEAKGRRRLQRCSYCKRWFERHQWVHDIDEARFGCIGCLAPQSD